MSKKNKGGFTPRTQPTILPTLPAEALAVVEAAEEVTAAVEEAGVEEAVVVEETISLEATVKPPSGYPLGGALDQWAASQGLDTTKMGDRDISRASQALETTSAKVRQILQERWLAANPPLPVPVDTPDPEVVDQVLEGVASTDPQVAIAVASLEGVKKLSIDTVEPDFKEPEKVTSVEVPHAHPKVEELSPKADTLPPEAPDTDKDRRPTFEISDRVKALMDEGREARKELRRICDERGTPPSDDEMMQADAKSVEAYRLSGEQEVALNPDLVLLDVRDHYLPRRVPVVAKKVSAEEVETLRPVAKVFLRKLREQGHTSLLQEGVLYFTQKGENPVPMAPIAFWLLDGGQPKGLVSKVCTPQGSITYYEGNEVILMAHEACFEKG